MRQLNSVKKHKGKGNVKAHQVTLNNNKISKLLYFAFVCPQHQKNLERFTLNVLYCLLLGDGVCNDNVNS